MTNAIGIISVLVVVVFSVIIHEVSHGFVALTLGDHTAEYAGRLTLDPFKHIDLFGSIILPILLFFTTGMVFGYAKPVPYNPYNLRNQKFGPSLVGLAGPAANIIIAIIFGTIIRIAGTIALSEFLPGFLYLASYIVMINLALALFNLIPIPPLDGSKLLYILLPHSYHNIIYQLEHYGIILVFVFAFMFFWVLFPLISFLFGLLTGLPGPL